MIRTIYYKEKPKSGHIKTIVDYVVLEEEDRKFIGEICLNFLFAMENDYGMKAQMLEPAYLGQYDDPSGETLEKCWMDLVLGLLAKYYAKINGTNRSEDYTKQQLDHLNKLLAHFGQGQIKFISKGQEQFKINEKDMFDKLFVKEEK